MSAEDNCQLIFDLPFCTGVAWSVPTNRRNQTLTANLASLYDEQAESYMKNFTNSLALTACETTSTSQYSLAVNCTTCAAAYKEWLCAVTIPRCTDYFLPDAFLQARNVLSDFPDGRKLPPPQNQTEIDNRQSAFGNQSRNTWIDENVKPGPYKEILPCAGMCHRLVQNCPPALQFVCPLPGKGLERSYGPEGDTVQCNTIGAVYGQSVGSLIALPMMGYWSTWSLLVSAVVVGGSILG
jgi:hypothetical protein